MFKIISPDDLYNKKIEVNQVYQLIVNYFDSNAIDVTQFIGKINTEAELVDNFKSVGLALSVNELHTIIQRILL